MTAVGERTAALPPRLVIRIAWVLPNVPGRDSPEP
jgi:hypothetical protein